MNSTACSPPTPRRTRRDRVSLVSGHRRGSDRQPGAGAQERGRLEADTALIEQAQFIPGIKSLEAGYRQARSGPYWTARRHPSGRISFRLCVREPELAAS